MHSPPSFLARADLGQLFDVLRDAGYRVVGPRIDQGAITFQDVEAVDDLPVGVTNDNAPGRVRLQEIDSARHFSWSNGAQTIKPLVYAPRESLWQVKKTEQGIQFVPTVPTLKPVAVFGARACDLAALSITDKHFLGNTYHDAYYAARRDSLFLIAVNCTHPASTCFCASTGDGPEVKAGADLVLDELDEGYLVQAGSERGTALLAKLPLTAAAATQQQVAVQQREACVQGQVRTMPSQPALQGLMQRLEAPGWERIAEACLACGNCTAACPTCFCHRETEQPALDGSHSQHSREWDSCFNMDHSYIVGEVVRPDIARRYRQWMTHKLATWVEQYGRTGCVGCGRCTAWCPAGIDFVQEAQAMLNEPTDPTETQHVE